MSRSQVTFTAGDNDGNTLAIFVDVWDDLLVEGTETITLSGSLHNPTTPGVTFVGGPVTLTILDDDGKIIKRNLDVMRSK